MSSRVRTARQFTGWHMLAILVLFFGTVITVNLTLAYFANSSWTGLIVHNGYVASQKFNDVTAEKRRQAALGWKSAVSYADGELSVEMNDRSGAPIRGAVVSAHIGHPVDAKEDQTATLDEAGDGLYSAAIKLAPGRWDIELTVTDAHGTLWTHPVRYIVKG